MYDPSGAKLFISSPMAAPPANTDSIILQLAIPVNRRIAAPIRIAIVEVSPIDPGISPKNIS